MRIGIDVGGTNTDAVILDNDLALIAATKTATTADVEQGIAAAIAEVLRQAGIGPGAIDDVMLGTTHCTNAILERKGLVPVAVLRIGAPAARAVAPLATWPKDLRGAVLGPSAIIQGGHEFDGRLIGGDLDIDELAGVADAIAASGVQALAITSVFAPASQDHEDRAAAYFAARLPHVDITRSHRIGSLGLLERENAAVLNAALRDVARAATSGLERALARLGIAARMTFAQNDGTLMALSYAERYPILTIGSGPTNSLRGAAWLSGVKEALVVDIGGTSTDVGALRSGYPRQSAVAVEIGGVRTNVRMPDILSIALGGGSVVHLGDAMRIGPQSVGYRITQEALVFGGHVVTATDVAVASGARLDDPRADAGRLVDLDPAAVAAARAGMVAMVEDAVDRMRTSAEALPVVLVGGGSLLLGETLRGASAVIRPPHHAHANAVGAAVGAVGGQVDRIFTLGAGGQREAVAQAIVEASQEAVAAGGDGARCEVLHVETVPLAYLTGDAVRIQVKVAAPLRQPGAAE